MQRTIHYVCIHVINMHVYIYICVCIGTNTDWTEYAMHIPSYLETHICGIDNINISEFQRLSGCPVRREIEYLRGKS